MEKYKLKKDMAGIIAAFTLARGIRIGVCSGGEQYIFEDIAGGRKIVRVGSWLAERNKGWIGLRHKPTGSSDMQEISIYFRNASGGTAADILAYFLGEDGRQKKLTGEGVTKLALTDESINITTADNIGTGPQPDPSVNPQPNPPVNSQPDPPVNPQPNPPVNPQPNPPVNPQPNPSADNRTIVVLQEELQKSRSMASELREKVSGLENDNRELQAANERLLNSAAAEVIGNEQEELNNLSGQTQSINTQLRQIRKEKEEKKKELARARQTLEEAQNELDHILSEKEVTQLDIDQTKEELRSISERLADDTVTAEAMADDSMIGTGSVKKSLEKAASGLKEAEKKIALIIKLRETINQRVQKASLGTGAEFLTTGEETGGH